MRPDGWHPFTAPILKAGEAPGGKEPAWPGPAPEESPGGASLAPGQAACAGAAHWVHLPLATQQDGAGLAPPRRVSNAVSRS